MVLPVFQTALGTLYGIRVLARFSYPVEYSCCIGAWKAIRASSGITVHNSVKFERITCNLVNFTSSGIEQKPGPCDSLFIINFN